MPIHYLSQVDKNKIAGKICILRVDLNVKKGLEKDAFRLQTIIPTIQLLLKNQCKIIIVSHRGKPEQKIQNIGYRIQGIDKKLSLKPFVPLIGNIIKTKVQFVNHFNFAKIKKQIENSKDKIFLLENIRFLAGEEKNDSKLAKKLASLADFYPVRSRAHAKGVSPKDRGATTSNGIYVNDAFPVCHRKNASVVAITKFLSSYVGLQLEKEIKNLDGVMKNARHPFTIIVGGAKIADKLGVIKNFWNKVDYFLFSSSFARYPDSAIILKPFLQSPKIKLPVDFKMSGGKQLDIGPKTEKLYTDIIKKSQTIIWNGPMGVFENKKFAKGTITIWKTIIVRCQMSDVRCQIIVGGGETIASLKLLDSKFYILNSRNVFISTGGGAMLQYLSGKKLAGIKALD